MGLHITSYDNELDPKPQ